MPSRTSVAALLAACCACATTRQQTPALPQLKGNEAEVRVYALPLPHEADRISFTIESISARTPSGAAIPLQVVEREVVGAQFRNQRLLAWGRVPAGEYAGLSMKLAGATVLSDGEKVRLIVAAEPKAIDLEFTLRSGGSVVAWLELKPGPSLRSEHEFSPAFTATIAPQTPPQVALYCSNTGDASVTVVDRRASRLVTGAIPVGEAPRGIVLDRHATRAYVSLSRADLIQILDVAADRAIGSIRLSLGDGPRDLALTPNGLPLVLNERSRTLAFVDPVGMSELGRVPVGDAPTQLLLDRAFRRAFVVNRASATITVVDIANHSVVATLQTDAEPLWVQVSRDNSRLYVIHRGSGNLGVFTLPALTQDARAYIALGATTMKVDPRSDLIYLSRGDERRISVYDPVSLQPADQFDVPGAVSYMAIDDFENTLLAVMPERRSIAVIDLTSRKLLAEIPVGEDPFRIAFFGERF